MYDVLILVHGYNHTLSDWEQCMWGNPGANVYGRASQALRIAEKYCNPVIFLGGGGSFHGKDVSDAQMTHRLVLKKAPDLYKCSFEEGTCPRSVLEGRLYIDTDTSNTTEEVKKAFELCLEKSIPNMILVSSPTHIARCLVVAMDLRETYGYDVEVYARPSDVNYKDTYASDVMVIEPPHLPGAHKAPFHDLVRRMIPFMNQEHGAQNFAKDLAELIERYENIKN